MGSFTQSTHYALQEILYIDVGSGFTGCGGLYTSPHGSIHSPNYPDLYDRNSDCVWTITVNPLHVVELNFTHFEVEHAANCSYDNITVRKF